MPQSFVQESGGSCCSGRYRSYGLYCRYYKAVPMKALSEEIFKLGAVEGECIAALKLPLRKGGCTSSLSPPAFYVGLPGSSASSC